MSEEKLEAPRLKRTKMGRDDKMTKGDHRTVDTSAFTDHRIQRGAHALYARRYDGKAPAFVLMHGFPDNLRIYDALAPLLAGAGRPVVAFDFLGYGGSDKPVDYDYTSAGMEDDLQAVVAALGLGPVVLVAHDASGPTAINWALGHPKEVAALALLNSYYDAAPTLRVPEFVSLFADPAYADLAAAFAGDPAQFGWLLAFQARQFRRGAPPALQERAQSMLEPIIRRQFAATPNAAPAFMGLTRDLQATLEANTRRAHELAAFARPVSLIWGAGDRYLNRGVAEHLHRLFPTSELALLPLGHWPQIDGPEEVARALLALPIEMGEDAIR
jgi:pimeloyl-ACP methyl ester carboxylesterase